MRPDEPVEVLDGALAQLDARHALEIVQGNRLPGARLLEPELRALERPWDAVEKLDDVPSVDVHLVDRLRKKRPGQGAFLRVRTLSQARELRRALTVERDVQAMPGASSHDSNDSTM